MKPVRRITARARHKHIFLAGLLLWTACAGGEGKEKEKRMFGAKSIPFEVIDPYPYYEPAQPESGLYQGGPGAGLVWIRSAKGWERAGFGTRLPASDAPPEAFSEPDFGKEDVLLLGLGRMPTTGYRLAFEKMELKGDKVKLAVKILPPSGPAGEMLTPLNGALKAAKLPAKAKFDLVVNGKGTGHHLVVLD